MLTTIINFIYTTFREIVSLNHNPMSIEKDLSGHQMICQYFTCKMYSLGLNRLFLLLYQWCFICPTIQPALCLTLDLFLKCKMVRVKMTILIYWKHVRRQWDLRLIWSTMNKTIKVLQSTRLLTLYSMSS